MFERIVAAIDSDTQRAAQVIRATQDLALALRSEVLVAHVREVERPAVVGKPGALPPIVHFESEETAQKLIDTAVNDLRQAGIKAQGQIGPGAGSTAHELLDIAQAFGADLILVGDRDSRLTDVVLGGVSHRILHLAKCPVLLVR